MACMAAAGTLKPGKPWRQEGILGTVFEGSFEFDEDTDDAGRHGGSLQNSRKIIPMIRGSAHVTAECTLIFDPADPFRLGVPE